MRHQSKIDGIDRAVKRRPKVPLPQQSAGTSLFKINISWRAFLLTVVMGVLIAFNIIIPIAAFEAHVVNVTAKIEPPPSMCAARSIGYWRNNEGCSQGTGSSAWTGEINALSAHYSGVFASYSGEQICADLWIPNCSSGNTAEARRCRARAHALADELDLVSHKLEPGAFIAGADDGDSAFDNLFLTPYSIIEEAMTAVEAAIINPSATPERLGDAAYVARRLYRFYEEENPFSPSCIFDAQQVPETLACCTEGDIDVENNNNAVIDNHVEVGADTGGNSAFGGGDIETGNATSTIEITNEINTNETGTSTSCCESGGDNATSSEPVLLAATSTPQLPDLRGLGAQALGAMGDFLDNLILPEENVVVEENKDADQEDEEPLIEEQISDDAGIQAEDVTAEEESALPGDSAGDAPVLPDPELAGSEPAEFVEPAPERESVVVEEPLVVEEPVVAEESVAVENPIDGEPPTQN